MARTIIPMRPENFKAQLNQSEQTALTWFVLSGCTRDEAFLTFARPDMAGSAARSVVKETIKQFFARAEVKDYIAAYTETLDAVVNPEKKKEASPSGSVSLEERKARAKTKLVEFAMSLADNIEQADDPEFVLKMADKCNLLDGDEQAEEQPRRYLPQSCSDHCAYRMFCEENTEDMCQYCRYHKFGEDNRIHYEKNNILDVPQRPGTKVAEEKVD